MRKLAVFFAALCGFAICPAQAAHWVDNDFDESHGQNTVVINMDARTLCVPQGDHMAFCYHVAVGTKWLKWSGPKKVEAKEEKPDWAPPPIVLRNHPGTPRYIDGDSPENPMGDGAIMLDENYEGLAIHGTNYKTRHTVGTDASSGCIRMLNEDFDEVFAAVDIGTPVFGVHAGRSRTHRRKLSRLERGDTSF